MGSPESFKMHRCPNIFHDFFSGMRSVGSPESLKMRRFPNIFHDFFGGMGSVGPRINENAWISQHFL